MTAAEKPSATNAFRGAQAPGAPVTFYVVRHGQTLFNVMGKVQGWCDTPLTEDGVRGAEKLGRGLAEVDFVAAYASDSGRAEQTLDVLLSARAAARGEASALTQTSLSATTDTSDPAATGAAASPALRAPLCTGASLPLAFDARLREWCYGDLEGEPGELLHEALTRGFGEDLSFEEHNRRLPEVANVIVQADTSGRAERFETIEQRLTSFFREAGDAISRADGGNVLVVTHSFVVRTLVYLLEPSRVNDPVKIPNTSVTRIHYDQTGFTLAEIGSTAWQKA
ncbi:MULTISPECIES: histidine phosphatase family protein [Gordonibacter]|uniref:Histidine phosphatase family protein n=1 Tax=Gordonibacter faecis TaxID=3047475 RepID=A0ABT7DJN9_9ACTN|nr:MULTISPECIES: histidine phosphatase family protein [unclassified Gordonibacter]MDJ1649738.1 histidine phosphatase family protein [Gordonibacter sp. KGMB12511]HIW76541.1 histidine phosphatase family protein [Candidatus Gordonibacter avicola]